MYKEFCGGKSDHWNTSLRTPTRSREKNIEMDLEEVSCVD
jgi:hypothetical protein